VTALFGIPNNLAPWVPLDGSAPGSAE